jgi:hypothetical protein
MAAIALRFVPVVAAAALLLCAQEPERSTGPRVQLRRIADSLTAHDTANAMAAFDKSYPDYSKLQSYFEACTAYQVSNELDVLEENDTATEAKLTVSWSITLTANDTDAEDRRSAELHIRMMLADGKWKIVEFRPISIFDPLHKGGSS